MGTYAATLAILLAVGATTFTLFMPAVEKSALNRLVVRNGCRSCNSKPGED